MKLFISPPVSSVLALLAAAVLSPGAYADGAAAIAIKDDDEIAAKEAIIDFVGVGTNVPSSSSSPSISLSFSPSNSPSSLPFTWVGIGSCVGTSPGGSFSYHTGSGDSYAECAIWCSQNINSKFVGFHRIPDLKQCGCFFADGAADDVELTDYDPDSFLLTMGAESAGPIISADGTPGIECYSYNYFLTAQPSEMASAVPSSQPSVGCVKRGDDPLKGETISKDHNSHRYEVSLATNGEFNQWYGNTKVVIGTLDQIVDNKATFTGGDHCFNELYRSGQVTLIEDCDKGYLEVTSIDEPSTCYYTMDITGICYCPPFTKVGDGYCRGAGNTVFSYHYKGDFPSRSACFDWCLQVITDDFVGIEYNSGTNWCNCLFSDGAANQIGSNQYSPASSGFSTNSARGPIISVYEYDNMECHSYDGYVAPTLSPTSSTWPSPDVTKVGDGFCKDGANKSFGNRKIGGHATSSPACYDWCSQAIIDEFVGFNFYDISGTKWCSCLFDYGGGLKVSYRDYTPNSLGYEGDFGRGPIVSVLERDGAECYSYNNYIPPTQPPSEGPSFSPSSLPSTSPSTSTSTTPSKNPSFGPSLSTSTFPSMSPSSSSAMPSKNPSFGPSLSTSTFPSMSPSSDSAVTGCLPKASRVKVQSITGIPISLLEVKVYSSGSNVALNKKAKQSSNYKGRVQFAASKAVDGNTSTFSHTNNKKDKCAWWEVELGATYVISSIKIQNRWCKDESDSTGCLCKLSFAAVSLIDANGKWVDAVSVGNACQVKEWEYVPEPSFAHCENDK